MSKVKDFAVFDFTRSAKPTAPLLIPLIRELRRKYLTEQKGDKTRIFFGTIGTEEQLKQDTMSSFSVPTTTIPLKVDGLPPAYAHAQLSYAFLDRAEAKSLNMNAVLLDKAGRGGLVLSALDLITSTSSFDMGMDPELESST